MIEILYQDADILVCIKPTGIAVEGTKPDLCTLLAEQTGTPVYAVHRLDAPVGGVMVFARTQAAAASLCRNVAERSMNKEYLAVVAGTPEPADGALRDWLYHDARANKTFVVKKQRKGVREAVLDYRTLGTAVIDGSPAALVRVRLHTGRTHQIRAQFAGHKHPLAGDGRYGSRLKGPVALFSTALHFAHPVSGEALSFTAFPPQEGFWQSFARVLQPNP